MERPVSFDVTDYNPSDDDWITDLVPPPHVLRSTPPSSPIHQILEMNNSEEETEYVEITLDIYEDRVILHSVTPVTEGGFSSVEPNSEPLLQQRNRTKKNSAVNGFANRPQMPNLGASVKLIGLGMFISMTDAGWTAVEKRFDKMTAKTEAMLSRSKFGACVGINSKEFALELFDTLARRCYITSEVISKAELWEFCVYINDQSFDSRFKLFFDMADKDDDGRLTLDEVREVINEKKPLRFIRLTASASNQAYTQGKADEYAALIMEELDPDDLGYIFMEFLEELLLLLDVETFSETIRVEERKKATKCWYRVIGDISSSSCIPFFKKRALKKKT